MDPQLRAQLRIAEIDGELESLHVDLTTTDTIINSLFPRDILLRIEVDLRRERQSLYDELERHEQH
jgi:hypothetical protein